MLKKKIPLADIVIVVLLVTLPFLYYLYNYFPDIPIWESKYLTIDSGSHESVQYYGFLIIAKVYLIILLSIWFITCKHWWRFVIFVPLVIEIFKLSGILNERVDTFDELDYIHSLPITIPIFLLILFLSKKMNNYSKVKDINTELTEEMNSLFKDFNVLNENRIDTFNLEFTELKRNKSNFNDRDYIKKLFFLRKKMLNI